MLNMRLIIVPTSPSATHAGSASSASLNQARTAAESNFAQVAAAMASLGGTPAMVPSKSIAHQIPDPLALAGYTAYVCARLLESAAEERAAFCIQSHWRKRSSWAPGESSFQPPCLSSS